MIQILKESFTPNLVDNSLLILFVADFSRYQENTSEIMGMLNDILRKVNSIRIQHATPSGGKMCILLKASLSVGQSLNYDKLNAEYKTFRLL